MNLMAEGVGHVGAVLRAETDAKIAATNARIDRIESRLERDAKFDAIREHRLFPIVNEALTRGEWVPWEWAEMLDVSEPDLLLFFQEFRASLYG